MRNSGIQTLLHITVGYCGERQMNYEQLFHCVHSTAFAADSSRKYLSEGRLARVLERVTLRLDYALHFD